jgi:putative MFS transporter
MPAFGWNLVMCFLMGVSAGGLLPIVYALMAESVPAKKRGWLVVLHGGLGTAAGYLATSGLAALLLPTFGWRILWFVGLPTGLLMLVLNRWIPESPRFLIERGRVTEAGRVMARYGARMREAGPTEAPDAPATGRVDPPIRSSARASLSRMFGRSYRTQTFTIGLYGLGWGVIYWGFITFLPTMLEDTTAFSGHASVLLFFSSLLAIPGTVLVAYLYGAWSSRKTMTIYSGATVCALLVFAFSDPTGGDSRLLLILLVMLLLAGSTGIIAMLSPYTAEVYPTEVRGMGSGFAAACSKAGGMFGPPLVASVLATFPGFTAVALLVAAPMSVATLVVALAGIETRGRKLEDIQATAEGLAESPHKRG